MRPYRGKRVDNGKWVYGWYLRNKNNKAIILIVKPANDYDTFHIPLIEDFVEVIPETVGQSIGLTDKNGKDLNWWESDILKFEFDYGFVGNIQTKAVVGKIIYKDGQYILESEDKDYELSFVIKNWHEVIGNVHENPELLKEKK